jgi:acyl-CoA thioesterase-1
MSQTLIEDNATVLFQGDSITDAGRQRDEPENMGTGYAMMAAAFFSAQYPEKNVRFLNRGNAGNTAKDLKNCWEEDCLDLKPTWVSIMVGINDTGQTVRKTNHVSIEDYETDLKSILEQAKEKPNARLILLEPFLLPLVENYPLCRKDLDPRIKLIHSLAKQYNAILIQTDQIFAKAMNHQPPEFWTTDGVHPTPPGHALIAQAWLNALNANCLTPGS